MFTPPPSPLPRDMSGQFDLTVDSSPLFLLPPPASSPSRSRSPSPSRSAFFPSPPASSSSSPASLHASPSSHHDRTSFLHAVQSHDRRELAKPIALAQPPAALRSTVKKAQGRRLRFLAFVIPALVVALTLLSRHWRHNHSITPPATLFKRGSDDSSSSSSSTSSSLSTTSSSTASTIPTPTGLPVAPASDADVVVPTPFPQPFDASLSANFTTSTCANFFTTFTASSAFRQCRSFGLLFANSRAFFQAQSNLTNMNTIVWGTCNTKVPADTCTQTMTDLATELKTSACAEDLRAGNALAVAALVGFSNYALYRGAACIVNPRSKTYCYLEALAASAPTDAYVYSLPLGISLPAGAPPTCSKCSQAVMSVMLAYAGNGTLPISKTYADAQNRTDATCGADYALPALITSGASARAGFALSAVVLLAILSL